MDLGGIGRRVLPFAILSRLGVGLWANRAIVAHATTEIHKYLRRCCPNFNSFSVELRP